MRDLAHCMDSVSKNCEPPYANGIGVLRGALNKEALEGKYISQNQTRACGGQDDLSRVRCTLLRPCGVCRRYRGCLLAPTETRKTKSRLVAHTDEPPPRLGLPLLSIPICRVPNSSPRQFNTSLDVSRGKRRTHPKQQQKCTQEERVERTG